jgi:hypothetical protein
MNTPTIRTTRRVCIFPQYIYATHRILTINADYQALLRIRQRYPVVLVHQYRIIILTQH